MDEKTKIFNQKVGKRLREVLDGIVDEKGKRISHGTISRAIGVTEQHLSYIINGHKPLTSDVAKKIIDCYCPETRISYLLGYDDDRTEKDVSINALRKGMFEGNSMLMGLVSFGKLCGFNFSVYDPDQDERNATKVIENLSSWYTIKKDGQTVKLSIDDMNQLENEICDFIEFKLNKLF